MARAFLVVMDSVGCGGAPDAAEFGDAGSNTLGHIAQACAESRAEQGRSGPLRLPNLDALGLGAAVAFLARATWGLSPSRKALSSSRGKAFRGMERASASPWTRTVPPSPRVTRRIRASSRRCTPWSLRKRSAVSVTARSPSGPSSWARGRSPRRASSASYLPMAPFYTA